MAKGYVVATELIRDPAGYRSYVEKVRRKIQQAKLLRPGRSYHHPSLVLFWQISVLDQFEAQYVDVVPDCFVVVPNDQSDKADVLGHV